MRPSRLAVYKGKIATEVLGYLSSVTPLNPLNRILHGCIGWLEEEGTVEFGFGRSGSPVFAFLRVCFWLLLLLLAAGPSLAQRAPTSAYQADFFGTEAGLPGQQVHDIEQTDDGYLWVATNGGLARFDGHRFVVFDSAATGYALPRTFRALYRVPGDTLLVIVASGDVLSYANGRFARYLTLPSEVEVLDGLARDRGWRLWGSANTHLLRLSPGRPQRILAKKTDFGPQFLYTDAAGDVWFVGQDATDEAVSGRSRCEMIDPERWTLMRIRDGEPERMGASLFPHLVVHPAERSVLRAWVGAGVLSLETLAGEARGRFPLAPTACPTLLGRAGQLWVKEGPDFAVYEPGSSAPAARITLGLRSAGLAPTLEDREGTIWIGTRTRGLVRIRRSPFQVYTTTDITGNAQVLSLSGGAGGSVLIRSYGYEVWRADATGATRVEDGGEPSGVSGVYEDGAGRRIYALSSGLIRWERGRAERILDARLSGGGLDKYFYPDPIEPDVLYLTAANTLIRIDGAMGPRPRFQRVLELPTTVLIRHVLRDRSGTLWVATQSGLYRRDGAAWERLTRADGLPHDHVRSLHEDPNGVLWVGTYGGGLARHTNGRFEPVTMADGLAEDVVTSILEDDMGYFWMSGNRGVHRTARVDLEAFLDGRVEHVTSVLYGRESGLLNPEASGAPAVKAADGRLWFATFEGAAVVDPAVAHRMGREPPIVHAEVVRVGAESRVPGFGERVELSADERRFGVEYVGLSLRQPEAVTYRYRLDGLDDSWVEAGTERLATYTNVPPGDYTFRVQARSAEGVWSEADGTLAISVAPFVYETWWFYVLAGLGAFALLGLGYQARVRTLRARENALSALIDERTAALRHEKETVAAQAEALRSLDKAKSQVFANVSHEFRTPLTLILGPLEDLRGGLHGPLSATGRRHVSAAIRSGQRLLRLVNQLLDLSRLESGHLELLARPMGVETFVTRFARGFESLAERSGVTFEVNVSSDRTTAYLDPEHLETILANLLGNAFKFTPEGGRVRLTTRTEAGAPGTWAVTVADDGPGLAPEHQARIFDRFYQVDASSTRRAPGTGIGLALAHSLVELHGGTLDVESGAGEGAAFTVRFPLGHAHLTDAQVDASEPDQIAFQPISSGDADENWTDEPTATDAADTDAATVLVVDDNPDIRAYVRQHLAGRFRVREARDGREALARAREYLPDCIVSDVMMPELDGFGLVQELRADPELAFVPVVLLTARASQASKVEGLELGADDYLTKPFDARELEVRVENLIAARQRLKAFYAAPDTAAMNLAAAREPKSEGEAFAARVRDVVEARLAEDGFSVEALAAAMGMGRTKLYEQMRDVLDQSPMDLVWAMRLERAAALLRERRGTVAEVAYGVGFKSVAHFSTRFREAYGTTPTDYAA